MQLLYHVDTQLPGCVLTIPRLMSCVLCVPSQTQRSVPSTSRRSDTWGRRTSGCRGSFREKWSAGRPCADNCQRANPVWRWTTRGRGWDTRMGGLSIKGLDKGGGESSSWVNGVTWVLEGPLATCCWLDEPVRMKGWSNNRGRDAKEAWSQNN